MSEGVAEAGNYEKIVSQWASIFVVFCGKIEAYR
jgi:hypothetical protein